MSRSPLEAGQTPQILPVGDAQTNIGCMILESLENRFHGAFLKHAVNLVEIQLDRDSSWVGEGLMEFGQKALSPQELEKTTLILLRREYEKIAIARANNVLVQVGTKDLGVVVKPLPKKKFLSLFQWAKKNNLITTETVVNLLPFWADLVPFHNPGKLEDLLKIYWNDASGEKKLKPSVPAKLLAGAVASRGLAEIIEKKEPSVPIANKLRNQAQVSIVMAGLGAAAIPETLSVEKMKPVVDEFFLGEAEKTKAETIRNILSGRMNNFGPAIFAFDSATTEEIYKALKDDTKRWKEQTVRIVTQKWPIFKKNVATLFPSLEEKDFTAMEVIMKRALFIPKEELIPRSS